ncbi:hypothetical protein FGO68_gene3402 [Halteria grandinella]|uniref:Uncharacterized protein n=1 Tax=Halteria grandinella TaxID=5974 RepID=A0A8J8T8J0_HALGN|nr:hypothetical protein FGO68_gene3402 [Halteria grandinella]
MGNQGSCCLTRSEPDSILQQPLDDKQYRLSQMIVKPNKDLIPGGDYLFAQLGDDETSLPIDTKYLKIDLERAFSQTEREALGINKYDDDKLLSFTINMSRIQLKDFPRNQDVVISCYVGEDYIEKAQEDMQKKQTSGINMDLQNPPTKLLDSPFQGEAGLNHSESSVNSNWDESQSEINQNQTILQESQNHQQSNSQLHDIDIPKVLRDDLTCINNHTRWTSQKANVENDGTAYVDEVNHFKHECLYSELFNQYLIFEFFAASNLKRPFSVLMLQLITLAVGPKHCDLEVKDIRFEKTIGRIQMDINVQQFELIEIHIDELLVSINGNEKRPLYSQFKIINDQDMAKKSDKTTTIVGQYNFEMDETKFKWEYAAGVKENYPKSQLFLDNQFQAIKVYQEISLDQMNRSTIQVVLRSNQKILQQLTEQPSSVGDACQQKQLDNMKKAEDLAVQVDQDVEEETQKINHQITIENLNQVLFNDDLVGECYLGFSKLQQNKKFCDKIWQMGEVIGTIEGSFTLSNVPILQQMVLGVLTEIGVGANISPISNNQYQLLIEPQIKEFKNNQKIASLIGLTQQLKEQDSMIVNNVPSKRQTKLFQKMLNKMLSILNQIIDTLIDYDKVMDGQMFKYNDQLDLIHAQNAMIDLAFFCLEKVKNAKQDLQKEYYEILCQIYLRDEFRLTNMALRQTIVEIEDQMSVLKETVDKKQIIHSGDENQLITQINQDQKNIHVITMSKEYEELLQEKKLKLQYLQEIKKKKIKVALLYQKLLYQMLDDSLKNFTIQVSEPYLRSYLEISISVAFFRIPQFQMILMNCIRGAAHEEAEMDITEWSNISWNLNEDTITKIEILDFKSINANANSATQADLGSTVISKLFDWEAEFFEHIPSSGEYAKDFEDSINLMRKIKTNTEWYTRIQKRSIAYFQIIQRLLELLKSIVKTFELNWQDIPGYKCIVKSVLQEMKRRKVSDYPESLIEVTKALVENPVLLTVMTKIIFLKTNVYDTVTLRQCMSLVTLWINHLETIGLPFPNNFDISFFSQGIHAALEIDTKLSTLQMLFNILHRFPIDARSDLIQEILSDGIFYSHFFSKSKSQRDLYFALMLYQIEYLYLIRTTELLGLTPQDIEISLLQAFQIPLEQEATTDKLGERKRPKKANALQVSLSNQIPSSIVYKKRREETLSQLSSVMYSIENQTITNPQLTEAQFCISITNKLNGQNQRNMSEAIARSQKPGILSFGQFLKQNSSKKQNQSIFDDPNTKHQFLQQSPTVASFLKANMLFKAVQKNIECLEEYFASHSTNGQAIGEKSIQRDNQEAIIRHEIAQKALSHIPESLIANAPYAIMDFYKQVEEYEIWKQSTAKQYLNGPNADMVIISKILPAFSMEQKKPDQDYQDDDKKEQW